MNCNSPLFLGIDLGTGGVRVLAVRADGEVLASHSVPFEMTTSNLPAGWHEQDARAWWDITKQAIIGVVLQLQSRGLPLDAIKALAVDGTSGTVVGIDETGEPVRPAMMYNDSRATEEAEQLAALAAQEPASPGGTIAASYAIAKVRWLATHEAAAFHKVKCFVHQADFIVGRLTGEIAVTDYSNALKMGFDLVSGTWPAWLGGLPGICERLPRVVAPGSYIASLREEAARELGLPAKVQVIAGATDGTAGFLASGAKAIGDDNTTLGTTLVFKRLSDKPVIDPRGLIYCHKLPGGKSGGCGGVRDATARDANGAKDAAGTQAGASADLSPSHPEDLWLPGAASNTGCQWMSAFKDDVKSLDARAAAHLPCNILAYPLARIGERFPFLAPQATGFIDPPTNDRDTDYAAKLQGVALLERLCYESLDAACLTPLPLREGPGEGRANNTQPSTASPDAQAESSQVNSAPFARPSPNPSLRGRGIKLNPVYATGGGSHSDVWMQLRADATARVYHRPAAPESAFGAAILAAAGSHFSDLWTAIASMVRIERTFQPDTQRRAKYDELFARFKALLRERGWHKA
ncbi:MAG: FGGY-family carbohydrate kinase [Phycisphaeraceae bacterium]